MRIKRDKTLVRGLFALNVFDVSKRKSAKIRFDFQKRLLDVDDVSTEIDWFLPSVHLGWWWRGEGFVAIRETDEREVSNREGGDLYRR